ncbi:MAG: hypothetical protein ACTSUE_04950 [Promethearchaeota archaeon]
MKIGNSCSTCQVLGVRAHEIIKDGELISGRIPFEEKLLEIVYSPFFDDERGYKHFCIKKCVECGRYYSWDVDILNSKRVKFVIITLVRLSKRDGEDLVRLFEEVIEADFMQFKARFYSLKSAFEASGENPVIHALSSLVILAERRGHDLSFTIPFLMRVVDHSFRAEEYFYVNQIKSIIIRFFEKCKDGLGQPFRSEHGVGACRQPHDPITSAVQMASTRHGGA